MNKPKLLTLSDFPVHYPLTTRWHDNDIYGHVNNVVYYSYFDSVVNRFLIEKGELDIHNGKTIGVLVHSECNYHSSLAYPDEIIGGLGILKLGNSSVKYQLGVFKQGSEQPSAIGNMTHVFVDRLSNKPVPIADKMRSVLSEIMMKTDIV
ncbi:acyl-CoA thioesterase [Glaciecola sp. 1036]|uniref:acyl-CoA thioesterase n=1 Tax=Alteromonadaceae TaxID=72275 RepID=UPI003D03FD0C